MGQHYLPQFYLRGFSDGEGIWAHDRKRRTSFCTQVKSVANENAIYSEELETHFANEVEDRAKPGIEKVRRGDQLTDDDRAALATYVVALWKRVPERRARVLSQVPDTLKELQAGYHEQLEAAEKADPTLSSRAASRKAEIDQVVERLSKNPPAEVWHESMGPNSGQRVVDALLSMRWNFLRSNSGEQFLTSDNPVFFFESEGIGRASSELSVPISATVVLWGTRFTTADARYVLKPTGVREFNRRTASNASRFVYSQRNEPWILPFVCKGRYALNRLRP